MQLLSMTTMTTNQYINFPPLSSPVVPPPSITLQLFLRNSNIFSSQMGYTMSSIFSTSALSVSSQLDILIKPPQGSSPCKWNSFPPLLSFFWSPPKAHDLNWGLERRVTSTSGSAVISPGQSMQCLLTQHQSPFSATLHFTLNCEQHTWIPFLGAQRLRANNLQTFITTITWAGDFSDTDDSTTPGLQLLGSLWYAVVKPWFGKKKSLVFNLWGCRHIMCGITTASIMIFCCWKIP